eukprot:9034706-Alexandrium_andersonii.AAC.1
MHTFERQVSLSLDVAPSVQELAVVMSSRNPNKAHSVDLVPPQVLRSCSGPLARFLHPLLYKCALELVEPTMWAGATP